MPKQKINDPGAHHASSGALIRRFLPYLVKYKKTLFLDLFCAALTTLCDIVLPKIMSTITNSAMGVGITLTAGIVLRLAALYFVLRIIDGAASYYMSSIGHIMGVHIETDMRRDAFDHLLRLDHTYYNNTKVGTIMGRITNDLFDVTEFAHHCPEEFFIAAIKIVVSFVILCQASIPLTLAVFACVPLMGVVSVYLNGRLRARFRQQRVQIGELNSTIEDSLLGQGVVKAFAAEAVEAALEALCTADAKAAQKIVKGDSRINNMERDIEHRCMTLLLRQQPVAGDLRRISTAMKVVTDIERIGDHASDIAEIIPHLVTVRKEGDPAVSQAIAMGRKAYQMIQDAMAALTAEDELAARKVIAADDAVDFDFNAIKHTLAQEIAADPAKVDAALDLLMVIKYLERIGDHAVNVAEWVQFVRTGRYKDESMF